MAIVDGHISCARCGESKPLGEFSPSFVTAGNGRCRPCQRISSYGKAWSDTAPPDELERVRAMRRGYYQKGKVAKNAGIRARRLRIDYGITVAQYDEMLAAQGGRCACCNAERPQGGKRLHVDHDHGTGQIRGLICHKCNRGIGLLGDTTDGLGRAIEYLERAQRRVHCG